MWETGHVKLDVFFPNHENVSYECFMVCHRLVRFRCRNYIEKIAVTVKLPVCRKRDAITVSQVVALLTRPSTSPKALFRLTSALCEKNALLSLLSLEWVNSVEKLTLAQLLPKRNIIQQGAVLANQVRVRSHS